MFQIIVEEEILIMRRAILFFFLFLFKINYKVFAYFMCVCAFVGMYKTLSLSVDGVMH